MQRRHHPLGQKHGDEPIRIHEVRRFPHEVFSRAESGKQFQCTKPQENDAQSNPQDEQAVTRHPVGYPPVDTVEDVYPY